ncbi:MAG: NADH-quinone oxidoreductase subunit E [Actinomycetia bacterium]|nr:NADH-quinone oxidoreductase subunit E [Actinomycetes bacterium]MCP4963272.1 NADH-quinone oxidoreductase subunit E [Actinomycetes bacterium]
MADLYISSDVASEGEMAAVAVVLGPDDDALVVEHERVVRGGTRRRHARRNLLLPALHALQNHAGWISPGGLNHVCERLQVPPAEAYGVATFYDLFRTTDPGNREAVTHVCVDGACQMSGANELLAELEAGGARVHASPCLGQCERAPATFVQGLAGPDLVPADSLPYTIPQQGDASLRLLRRIGVVDPTDIDSYRHNGGFAALERARELGPTELVQLVTDSGLSGRGGAAFPTGVKWAAVRAEVDTGRSAHVVANADESEPGTFKDRVLIENDPFSLVEALLIAGYATGATHGWIYIRGEYPLATARLEKAVAEARTGGLLGANALGEGHNFDITIRRGAGAYVCGEETALFNSIEGFRGEPRNKPPFPTTHGLFGEPTAINNPETLVNVLHLLTSGISEYRTQGTERSPATKLFCLSGAVLTPGLYEAPFGITLGELLEMAGGVRGDLRAVLMGGAAGSFVDRSFLDMALTLEDTQKRGTTLGSGVVMVFNTEDDIVAAVSRIAEFFRDESCGQCVPCRIGTQRQHEIVGAGVLDAKHIGLIDEMAAAMRDASICGLGHTASNAVQSAIRLGLIGAGK